MAVLPYLLITAVFVNMAFSDEDKILTKPVDGSTLSMF